MNGDVCEFDDKYVSIRMNFSSILIYDKYFFLRKGQYLKYSAPAALSMVRWLVDQKNMNDQGQIQGG